jgi:hypothetical protein
MSLIDPFVSTEARTLCCQASQRQWNIPIRHSGARRIPAKFMDKATLQTTVRYCNQILAFAGMTRVQVEGEPMKKISSLHNKWVKDPSYRKKYEALEEEFALASENVPQTSKRKPAVEVASR